MANFCPNCGQGATEGARFCANCGQSLDGSAPAVSTPKPAVPNALPQPDLNESLWSGSPDAVLSPVGAKTTKYVITRSRLIVDKGLLGKKYESLELYRIKDISVKKSLPQRARSCGDVVISSTDVSTPTLTLEAITEPDNVADNLRRLVQEARQRSNVYMREGL